MNMEKEIITKKIIIFANSVKMKEHCVAGKDIDAKKWIRPVSASEGKELTGVQCTCVDSQNPVKLLQQINITFSKHDPLENQPENYLISDEQWIQCGSINRDEVIDYLDKPDNLWIDRGNQNDRVAYNLIEAKTIQITQSLYLIEVEKIHIYWKDRLQWNQNSQRRGEFEYKKIKYDLAITDPNFEQYRE